MTRPPERRGRFARALHFTATLPLALLLLFEEWGWGPLSRAAAWLGRLPAWAWLERRIAALPSWAAVAVFGVPVLALVPVKLLALWLFGTGHAASGLALLVAAKVVGTAIVARLFTLTQPALMRYGWFARGYWRWKGWKDTLLLRFRSSAPWQAWRRLRAGWRRRLRRLWRRFGPWMGRKHS
ncbi:hypothetical protein [Xylophilus sp.]|uniref:hypothetical protein n=1 Tax=Xylophilus sp. TaxID=2653893 RepID=UPI0013B897EE|nr:hypothetical protein [Xylophilus sp.]KAF1048722.1 MAG: hypothetical protein GAK38_01166 [Xylophilus sp.]